VYARACSPACFYHICCIRQVRRFVDEPALKQLIQAFVTSCLDYFNALFADCSDAVRQRLQQHSEQCGACHSLTASVHTSHTAASESTLAADTETCHVQLCVLMFDTVRGSAPSYLTDLCNICSDDRLRSASRGLCSAQD